MAYGILGPRGQYRQLGLLSARPTATPRRTAGTADPTTPALQASAPPAPVSPGPAPAATTTPDAGNAEREAQDELANALLLMRPQDARDRPARMDFGPEERAMYQQQAQQGNFLQRGLAGLDQRIQDSQGLMALAPLGMVGGGAGAVLGAANMARGVQTGQPSGFGLGGLLGAGIGRMVGNGPQRGTNIDAAEAASLAGVQRRNMAQQIRDNRDRSANRTTQQAARERSLSLAERSARNPNDLPY